MPRLTDLFIVLGCSLAAAAEIIGQAWADDLSINGTSLQSTNHGSITASGAFDAGVSISGGQNNRIGVTAAGASISLELLNERSLRGDTLAIKSTTASASNDGSITAKGTFNGSTIAPGTLANTVSVTAAGTSINLSITKR